ncbi:MAG: ATP-grasp domain-containing protein [Woeseiaceae bacterium]
MSGKRCAFLTMDNTDGWSIDADLGIAPLQARNWQVDWVPWRSTDVDWNRFDAVYIGTPWDYPDDFDRFIGVLERIDASRAVLVNDLALVRWNIPKTYLRELEVQGAVIVPSLWYERLEPGQLAASFDRLGTGRIIAKPLISTNATDTFLLTPDSARRGEKSLVQKFSARGLVIQPFVENVQTEGEYSLFYFGDHYSHAIRKIPKARDFRVQEEHGARIEAIAPDEALVQCADRILELVKPVPVYARCDLVRAADGGLLLMELELIEPSMYLRMDADAAERFAIEFDRHVASA